MAHCQRWTQRRSKPISNEELTTGPAALILRDRQIPPMTASPGLIHKKNYFRALDLEYPGGDFEFAFQFLSQYFNLEENSLDYLWVDDTDWVYSAEDIMWLSRQPYHPEWHYKKLTA